MLKMFSSEWRIRLSHHPELVVIKSAAALIMMLSGNTAWCFLSMFMIIGTAVMTGDEIDTILPMTDRELKGKRMTTVVMLLLKYTILRLLGRGIIAMLYHFPATHQMVEEIYNLDLLFHHTRFMIMFFVMSTLSLLELAVSMALGQDKRIKGKRNREEKDKREKNKSGRAILLKILDFFSGGFMISCGFSILIPKVFVLPDYEDTALLAGMAVCSLIELVEIVVMVKRWRAEDVRLEQMEF